MPRFNTEELMEIMKKPQHIRNMSVIAHVDHGKTTLCDSLIAFAGIISDSNVGGARTLDTGEEEKNRGITIKSTGISMYYELESHDQVTPDGKPQKMPTLINLIDCPGHVDFSSEVTAALRVTDGALVVVDYVEGVCVQTETVLRQALGEKIKPVLMINKIDRGILELQVSGEVMYQKFLRVIENANMIISTYECEDMPESQQVDPSNGTVCFGAALFGWAFSIRTFARIYSKKFNIPEEVMMKKLWGDNFYDPATKKWQTDDTSTVDGSKLERGFVKFVMNPIIKMIRTVTENNKEAIQNICSSQGIKLKEEDLQQEGKQLMKTIMMKWLHAADALLEMIVTKLPSPSVAQQYRTGYLYEGPADDPCSQAMMKCDPDGPLMVYISKMVKSKQKGVFYAFGRVFSGTAKAGPVRIMGPNYVPGKNTDLWCQNIQSTVLMMGAQVERVSEVPCGNTVGLVGIDKYLMKTGTLSTYKEAHNIRPMKYSVAPVVRVAVKPKNVTDLPKLIEGLKSLQKADPLAQVITDKESGENIIAGCGELHIEICLRDLEIEHAQVPIIVSEPVVNYRETVTETSEIVCLSKSQNKHNRLYAQAEPLGEELCRDLENGVISAKDDQKKLAAFLHEKYGWDLNDAKKIWCFGPEEMGPNILVDMTKGVQYMNEIKDSCQSAFQEVTFKGVLAEEPIRGMRINITDSKLIADAIHRGGGQIIPAAKRLYYAAQYTAKPKFLEPVFLCEIQAPDSVLGGIYSCLSKKRGEVIGDEIVPGTPLRIIKAYLPVAESFGFTEFLRAQTQGKAFPQCVFDHWQVVETDPMDPNSRAGQIAQAIRKRKGLKPNIPSLEEYNDKL